VRSKLLLRLGLSLLGGAVASAPEVSSTTSRVLK
jgi:hypothetical protein